MLHYFVHVLLCEGSNPCMCIFVSVIYEEHIMSQRLVLQLLFSCSLLHKQPTKINVTKCFCNWDLLMQLRMHNLCKRQADGKQLFFILI